MSFDDENEAERQRQRLIRYVECVKDGVDFGDETPWRFRAHAPEDHDESGETDDATPGP